MTTEIKRIRPKIVELIPLTDNYLGGEISLQVKDIDGIIEIKKFKNVDDCNDFIKMVRESWEC